MQDKARQSRTRQTWTIALITGVILGAEAQGRRSRYTATNCAFTGLFSDFIRYMTATQPLHRPLHTSYPDFRSTTSRNQNGVSPKNRRCLVLRGRRDGVSRRSAVAQAASLLYRRLPVGEGGGGAFGCTGTEPIIRPRRCFACRRIRLPNGARHPQGAWR